MSVPVPYNRTSTTGSHRSLSTYRTQNSLLSNHCDMMSSPVSSIVKGSNFGESRAGSEIGSRVSYSGDISPETLKQRRLQQLNDAGKNRDYFANYAKRVGINVESSNYYTKEIDREKARKEAQRSKLCRAREKERLKQQKREEMERQRIIETKRKFFDDEYHTLSHHQLTTSATNSTRSSPERKRNSGLTSLSHYHQGSDRERGPRGDRRTPRGERAPMEPSCSSIVPPVQRKRDKFLSVFYTKKRGVA